jgi:hypothetical protein
MAAVLIGPTTKTTTTFELSKPMMETESASETSHFKKK